MSSITRGRLPGILLALTLLALLLFVVHPPNARASQEAPPVVTGWGGSRLLESSRFHQPNPTSAVFPNENASDMEMQARLLVQKGFNGYRASFAPYCTDPEGFFGAYNASELHRSIEIAAHYGLWIIVDYHGYDELQTSSTTTCWLNFWQNVVQQFTPSYDRIIWEPLNEPNATYSSIVAVGADYQQWINQARNIGDNHWVVVENLCSFSCKLPITEYWNAYPTVNDPLGKLFISLHTYFEYGYHYYEWSNATADTYAQAFVHDMILGTESTGWPVLNTEGGPGRPFGELANETTITCPDLIVNGSSGYCKTNFHFIQTLTNLVDNQTTILQSRLNWLWFPIGDWSSTPGAGIYGSLSPNGPGWGTVLSYKKTEALSFSVSASPNVLTMYPGTSKTVLAEINSTGFVGNTTLTTTTMPIGPIISLSNTALKILTGENDTAVLTITIPTGTQIGDYRLTLTCSIGIYGFRTANVALHVRDFALSIETQRANVLAGQHADEQISIQGLNNFNDSISLSATSNPSDANATVSPSTVTVKPGQTSFAMLAFNSTVSDIYNITVVARSGPLSHTTNITVVVEDFTIGTQPYDPSMAAGTNKSIIFHVSSLNGFSGKITVLSRVSPIGPGTSISVENFSLNPGETYNTTLTFSSPATVSPGSYKITITANGEGITHTLVLPLTVAPGPRRPAAPTPQFTIMGLDLIQLVALASLVAGAGALIVIGKIPSRLAHRVRHRPREYHP